MGRQADASAHDKEEERQQWDGVAAGWRKWWPTIENGAHCVSERMIELAEVGPGRRVLDIATGIGEPALMAAHQVGSAGHVVATDLSPHMLAIARERAAAAGLTNIEFLETDAERLELGDRRFDAVLWRWGPMDLSDPSATFAAIRRMLAPEGCFAASVWAAGSQARPLASLASEVAREMFGAPPPSPAETSPPENSLALQLTQAGFSDVRVEEIELSLAFGSPEDCTEYLRDVSPQFAAMFSSKSSAQQEEFGRRLADRLQQYLTAEGAVRIPNVAICAAGRK